MEWKSKVLTPVLLAGTVCVRRQRGDRALLYAPGLNPVREVVADRDVLGPHGAAEAQVRVVSAGERLLVVAVLDDWEHRAELLLVHDARALLHVGDDRRLVEVALASAVHDLAASGDRGALLASVLDDACPHAHP